MPSPAVLVTLDQAKAQLRITHSEEDLDLYQRLADAEDIVVSFMGERYDETWTGDTVPGAVRAAILKQLVYLWAHRGDTDQPDLQTGVAPGVRFLLQATGYRDLTIG